LFSKHPAIGKKCLMNTLCHWQKLFSANSASSKAGWQIFKISIIIYHELSHRKKLFPWAEPSGKIKIFTDG
jgi:hypothetical protein